MTLKQWLYMYVIGQASKGMYTILLVPDIYEISATEQQQGIEQKIWIVGANDYDYHRVAGIEASKIYVYDVAPYDEAAMYIYTRLRAPKGVKKELIFYYPPR